MVVKKRINKKKGGTAHRKRKTSSFQISESALRDIGGVAWGLIAILFFLSTQNLAGPAGESVNNVLVQIFGLGVYVIPFVLMLFAVTLIVSKTIYFNWLKNIGIILLISSVLGLIHMRLPLEECGENVEQAGGWIGFVSSCFFRIYLQDTATFIILIAVFLIGILICFEITLRDLISLFVPTSKFKIRSNKDNMKNKSDFKIIKPEFAKKELPTAIKENPQTFLKKDLNIIKPDITPKKKKEILEIKETDYSEWEFPSLDLLTESSSETFTNDRLLMKNAEKIRQKFSQFGIDVTMKDVHVGPTVTQYSLLPNDGIKLTKITTLKNDLALALAARSLRIEAPIPGKSVVGIELPNEKRTIVHMREMLESEEYSKIKSSLRLALGRNVSGKAIIIDLEKMPHLLIAGATGSGKSVGMNSFIISLLYQNSPQDLKFIMIDPKRVELSVYNSIPHLLTPVITEADKALSALKWAVAEMMRRYTECSKHKCRNILEYNQKAEQKMPKIVIVIDELADLMMRQYKKDTEAAICRLAQMARAVGMHLIIATQRPSVDVITGLIKANIPSRIAFSVTSSVDSRTILDGIGAEDLLGMGDMLFLNSTLGKPLRIQGIYVSTEEVQRVSNRIKITVTEPEYTDITRKEGNDDKKIIDFNFDEDSEKDSLIGDAISLIKQTGKASASLFQRHLKVGYARAARLLDILEEKNIVGPAKGAKPRDIYIDLEEKDE